MTPIVFVVDNMLKAHASGTGIGADSLQDMIKQTLDGLTLLASASFDVNMRRRDNFRGDVNPSFKSLCAYHVPLTTQLFGDDISKTVKDIGETNRLGQKMSTFGGHRGKFNSKKSFLGHRNAQRGNYNKKNHKYESRQHQGNKHFTKKNPK